MLFRSFGIVAMVAMTPLLAIQILGLWSVYRQKKQPREKFALDETELIEMEG